ncbi:MAG: hypothetical protein LBF71_03325 [Campylobacteraceae bacterium]|nr:hypothetical protein [Campylobacteraceae bacterium]
MSRDANSINKYCLYARVCNQNKNLMIDRKEQNGIYKEWAGIWFAHLNKQKCLNNDSKNNYMYFNL